MHPINQTTYQKSLKILGRKAPLLKTLLSLHPLPLSDIEYQEHNSPLAEEELGGLLAHTTKGDLSTFFIYETAFAAYYQELKGWLHEKEERHLLFFSETLGALQLLLSTSHGLELLQDPKIDLLYLKTPDFWQQNQKHLQSRLNLPFEIISHKGNQEKTSSFQIFKEKLIDLSMDQNALFSEYIYGSAEVYNNAFYNFQKISDSYFTHHLFNKFKGIPAIICGAGPSMDHCAKELGPLHEKALIFSGGRSLSVLNQSMVQPHFTIGLDPNATHHTTYSQNTFFELPLIYKARMHHKAIEKAHGELLYTPLAIGYPLIEWIEKKLGIRGPVLEEGMNVVNFSLQLATAFGCNPIILVGCDLAYSGENPYSNSCTLYEHLPKSGSIDPSDYTINRGTYKKNGLGQEVYTLWKWVEEAKWMGDFAKNHPQTHFINTTLGGLHIENFSKASLSEVHKLYLKRSFDLEGICHQNLLEQSKPKALQASLRSLYLELNESLISSISLLKKLTTPETLNARHEIIEEDLKSEVAYQKMLHMLEELFDRVEHEKDIKKRKQKRATFLLSMALTYSQVLLDYLD